MDLHRFKVAIRPDHTRTKDTGAILLPRTGTEDRPEQGKDARRNHIRDLLQGTHESDPADGGADGRVEELTMEEVICPYCSNPAEWVDNAEVYGRSYGKSSMIWLCRPCGAYVGCHNNTTKPLGTLANKELRDLRKKAHEAIDPIWQSGKKKRKEVYIWLMEKFGREIHIGQSDIETCKAIIEYVKTI